MTQYRNIFIDLDDTIWDFDVNSHKSLEIIYNDLNLSRIFPDYEMFSSMYFSKNRELWTLYHHGEITKEFLIVERFAYLFRTIGYNDPDNAMAIRINKCYLEKLAQQKTLVPHAVELLEYLHRKNYRLFILSNGFIEVQRKKLQSAGIDSYFSRMILSDEIGITKPARELFDFALTVTDSSSSDSLMIGDNYDADIMGAANAGWGQIYFDRFRNGIPGKKPLYTVYSLDEITTIL